MHSLVIVDDEKLIREGLVSYIDWGSLDIRVVGVCATADEALKKVRDTGADVVLTDIRMPGMDGIELLKRLRGVEPPCEVVFISAYRNFEYARKAIRYGAFDYVVKPIREAALYETFRRCIRHLEERSAGGANTEPPPVAAMDELRLYLLAGLPDAQVWSRLSATLGLPSDARTVLAIVRTEAGTERGFDVEALRGEYQAGGATTLTIELEPDETVILGSHPANPAARGSPAPRPQTDPPSPACRVGTSSGGGGDDPIRLYLEASWALAALSADPAGRSMEYREVRNALSRNSYPAVTSLDLANGIMGEDEPDLAALTWRLFAGLARERDTLDPGPIRLGACAVVDGAVGRLASYPTLAPAMAGLGSLGRVVARERSIHGILAATRAYLAKLAPVVRGRLSPGISRRIADAVNLVRDHPGSEASLAGVARRLLVSPGYLSRAFSREMSESFSHFRSRTRIERACELLRDHRYKVYEVAEMVGFGEVTHFTKVFAKITGMSPTEYRRSHDRTIGDAAP